MPDTGTSASWSRDELLIALSLYCQLPFGKMYARNPTIVRIAQKLARTPSALAMKLTNFASLDPEITATGRRGLANASRADREIWDDMRSDWQRFAVDADGANRSAGVAEDLDEAASPEEALDYTGSARPVEAMARIGQQFFRRAVLSAYDYRCCVTGLGDPALLLASHIIPWGIDPKNRLNPRNGLCLSALHDRAFDSGLITIQEDMTIRVSKSYTPQTDTFFEVAILAYDGLPIRLPDKFRPDGDFLDYHRANVFRS